MCWRFLLIMLFAGFLIQTALPLEVKAPADAGKIKRAITLMPEQLRAMDLKVAKVMIRPMVNLLSINAEVQLLPDRQADVSVRINGQVTALYANLGDRVKKGQPLVKIQSRLVGNPPPSVVIPATMSGIIDARNIKLGQSVEPNTILFHISNRDRMNVVGQVYEEDIGKVKLDQAAIVHVLGYPQYNFMGRITFLDPNLDPLTRTIKIWVQVNNPQGLLKPNMFAKVNIILKRNKTAVTVPNNAFLQDNGETFVFVKEGSQYRRVVIRTGAADDVSTEVTSGLTPNDIIVIQGQSQLYTLWLAGGQTIAATEKGPK